MGAKAHIELVLPFIIAAKIAVLGKVLLLLNINISVTYVTNSWSENNNKKKTFKIINMKE